VSKLGVEDGINDWVEGAVDVAQPDETRQHQRIDATEHHGTAVRLVLLIDFVAYTDGFDDVDGEEWQPTEQKHGYTHAEHKRDRRASRTSQHRSKTNVVLNSRLGFLES